MCCCQLPGWVRLQTQPYLNSICNFINIFQALKEDPLRFPLKAIILGFLPLLIRMIY